MFRVWHYKKKHYSILRVQRRRRHEISTRSRGQKVGRLMPEFCFDRCITAQCSLVYFDTKKINLVEGGNSSLSYAYVSANPQLKHMSSTGDKMKLNRSHAIKPSRSTGRPEMYPHFPRFVCILAGRTSTNTQQTTLFCHVCLTSCALQAHGFSCHRQKSSEACV